MPSACRFADKAGVSANQLSLTLPVEGSAAIARIEAAGAAPQPPATVQFRHHNRRHPPLPGDLVSGEFALLQPGPHPARLARQPLRRLGDRQQRQPGGVAADEPLRGDPSAWANGRTVSALALAAPAPAGRWLRATAHWPPPAAAGSAPPPPAGPAAAPGALPVLPPDRHHVAEVGEGLGCRKITRSDVAPTRDAQRGKLAHGDPATRVWRETPACCAAWLTVTSAVTSPRSSSPTATPRACRLTGGEDHGVWRVSGDDSCR